jgi:hypothetical protein
VICGDVGDSGQAALADARACCEVKQKQPRWKEINLHLWMQGDRARLAAMSGARLVFCGRLKE